MNFAFNQTVLTRALEQSGVVLGMTPELWIESYIRDDFNLKPTNNEIIKLILESLPSALQTLVKDIRNWRLVGYSEIDHLRMFVFAYVMTNDVNKFHDYTKTWQADTEMFKRFTNAIFDEHHISFHFEEVDE